MRLDSVNRLIGEMMSGLFTRYDLGSELDVIGRLIGNKPISHGGAGVSLYDVMQDGMGILLDASIEGNASKLVAASTQRIRCVAVDTGPSMLIRPDACVAWVGEENSTDGLEEALCRWFKPLV
jgi:molybdopterin biosynthesis enzyme MoaB